MDKETECMWTVPIFFSLYILGGMGYNLIVEALKKWGQSQLDKSHVWRQ